MVTVTPLPDGRVELACDNGSIALAPSLHRLLGLIAECGARVELEAEGHPGADTDAWMRSLPEPDAALLDMLQHMTEDAYHDGLLRLANPTH
jgi:hypothetical protein